MAAAWAVGALLLPVLHKGYAVCSKCERDQALLCVSGSVDKTEGQVPVHLPHLSHPLVMKGTQEVTIESGEVRGLPSSTLVRLCHNPVPALQIVNESCDS